MLSALVIASVSVVRPERSACSLLGVGWICHALFDLAFGHSSSTRRLPRWYPTFCAGFDVQRRWIASFVVHQCNR